MAQSLGWVRLSMSGGQSHCEDITFPRTTYVTDKKYTKKHGSCRKEERMFLMLF